MGIVCSVVEGLPGGGGETLGNKGTWLNFKRKQRNKAKILNGTRKLVLPLPERQRRDLGQSMKNGSQLEESNCAFISVGTVHSHCSTGLGLKLARICNCV